MSPEEMSNEQLKNHPDNLEGWIEHGYDGFQDALDAAMHERAARIQAGAWG